MASKWIAACPIYKIPHGFPFVEPMQCVTPVALIVALKISQNPVRTAIGAYGNTKKPDPAKISQTRGYTITHGITHIVWKTCS